MANREHLKILKEGVEAWNKWRRENPDIVPDLSGADLSETNLSKANLIRANLSGADLSETNLSQADLMGTNLSVADLRRVSLGGAYLIGVILRKADLRGADLRGAHLSWVNLSGANLSKANLIGANLSSTHLNRANLIGANLGSAHFKSGTIEGANFTDSKMVETLFADIDLSQAKGLETVKHDGPSSIGTDTLERSRGKIPEVFLRGAGVSDEFIAFIRAMGGAIQFYSCFISYSRVDQLFAERLYADLQARGVRCWFAPHDVQGGKKLHEQIDDAIRVHERLLLILSPSSIHSEWVKTEIAKARKREVLEKRRMLFPVALKISFEELKGWDYFDADIGKDSAREIREYYIPDFSQWERPENFKEEFEKLVRDLEKAETASGQARGHSGN